MNTPSRRRFLQLSGASALLAMAPATLAAPATPPVPAFGRKGAARLRLSLAAYSFREFFPVMRGKPNTKVPPGRGIDMERFADYCLEQGCDGAELTSYFFSEETDAYLLGLRRYCFLRGLPISGTAIGNNFSHPPGPKHAAEIATTKKWIDRAALLGAPHIRVFAGVSQEWPRDQADRQVVQALEEVCDYAGQRGIFLGLENHDSIGSAATLLPMVKAVKSPWIGVNLDSGNFRTDDPYRDFAECVPYAVNVQIKVEMGRNGGRPSEPADLARLVRILRDGGYQGWVALEYEAKEDPWVAVPRHLASLRALIDA